MLASTEETIRWPQLRARSIAIVLPSTAKDRSLMDSKGRKVRLRLSTSKTNSYASSSRIAAKIRVRLEVSYASAWNKI